MSAIDLLFNCRLRKDFETVREYYLASELSASGGAFTLTAPV